MELRHWLVLREHARFDFTYLISIQRRLCEMESRTIKIGEKYHRLLALERTDNDEKGRTKFRFKCDCGKEIIKYASHVYTGRTRTCGCQQWTSGKNNKLFKGCEDITGDWWHNHVLRSCNGSSKTRKPKEINITVQDGWELFEKQNGKCAYTGLDLMFGKTSKNNTASLDRIDSNRGYIKGNVQWVHKDVNFMKRTFPHEYFIKMCKLIANKE